MLFKLLMHVTTRIFFIHGACMSVCMYRMVYGACDCFLWEVLWFIFIGIAHVMYLYGFTRDSNRGLALDFFN